LGTSCNDPITIIDTPDEEIGIVFSDTFTVNTKTIIGEFASTYNLGINYSTYLLGALDDPIFGKSASKTYVELNYRSSLPFDFEGSTIDSAVLVMQYDTLGFYGDTTARYEIEVRQMIQQMDTDTVKSNDVWNVDPTIIGSRSIVPNFRDSLVIMDHLDDGNLDTIAAELRIPMTNVFAQSLLDADASNYETRESLLDFINGLEISATTDKSAMMGLGLSDSDNFNGNNKLRLFYSKSDSARIYDFSFTTRTASTFIHDRDGYEVEAYIADENHNDNDRAFFQGMSGVEVEFSFPHIDQIKDRIINNVELVYYSESDPTEVNMINQPVDLATLTYINDEGNRTLTSDASFGINPGPYSLILGGVPELIDESNGIYRTSVNLTSQFNTVFNRDDLTSNVILTPLQRSERSSRTIIFGSGDPQYKPVLKITYTDI